MSLTFSNPPTVRAPGSRYSMACLVQGPGQRLVISGQIAAALDGTIPADGPAQVRLALANLMAILDAHGMGAADIVKMTVFLTDPALIPAWREARGEALGEAAPTSTLLIVAGLADPRFLVEVEAEAFRAA
jgi:enamine deaminase RidA (YjgF/YER057c/UK114 family)